MGDINYYVPSRRCSNEISIGNLKIGGNNSIAIQSMCNTHTTDVSNSIIQIQQLNSVGADLVRLTVPTMDDVKSLNIIRLELNKQNINIPLCADVHFNASLAFASVSVVEKVRVNPGNFAKEEDVESKFLDLLKIASQNNVAIRVGVNHGSLSSYMMNKWGDTPQGMVESAMEYLRIAAKVGFSNIVVSLKSSNPRVMVESYRLCVQKMAEEKMRFPLHIGVTEAGEGSDGRIRSAVGIGSLLADGIGDTIRVSLTEDPVAEIPVAKVLADYFQNVWNNTTGSIVSKNVVPKLAYNQFAFKRLHDVLPIVVGKGGDYENGQKNWLYINSIEDILSFNLGNNSKEPIVLSTDSICWVGTIRYMISYLQSKGINNPIILRKNYNLDYGVDIISAAEFGAILIDGIADGIWIENKGELLDSSLGYTILQAVRLRLTKAEIISCPGCGRTQYDIQTVAKEVKNRFSKYRGIKIAVMGCIVNGPGEMADADWGYVGAGGGKVTIYHGHEPVYRNIPQTQALDLLEKLIKESNHEC